MNLLTKLPILLSSKFSQPVADERSNKIFVAGKVIVILHTVNLVFRQLLLARLFEPWGGWLIKLRERELKSLSILYQSAL